MLTVKTYQTNLDHGEIAFFLVEGTEFSINSPEKSLEDALSKSVICSEEYFSDHEEALKAGVAVIESLTGKAIPLEHEFECFALYMSQEEEEKDDPEAKLVVQKRSNLSLQKKEKIPTKDLISDMTDAWFQAYKKFGGRLSSTRCVPLFAVFNDYVAEAVTGSPADDIMMFEANERKVPYREVAYDRWTAFMGRLGHKPEADKIWRAVDSVTALS